MAKLETVDMLRQLRCGGTESEGLLWRRGNPLRCDYDPRACLEATISCGTDRQGRTYVRSPTLVTAFRNDGETGRDVEDDLPLLCDKTFPPRCRRRCRFNRVNTTTRLPPRASSRSALKLPEAKRKDKPEDKPSTYYSKKFQSRVCNAPAICMRRLLTTTVLPDDTGAAAGSRSRKRRP